MLFSPLEQFQIYPLINFQLGFIDLSFTNSSFIIGFSIFCFLFCFDLILFSKKLIPKSWQLLFETIYLALVSMIIDNIGEKSQKVFPFIFTLFFFIIISNLIGLVPYSFTITSHLIVTFSLALMIFIGVNIICIKEHGKNLLSLFLPKGTSLALAFILVPIEIVSYIFKPLSLSVRLFANMMAGHILLKVIGGFGWTMMTAGGVFFIFHFIPLSIIVVLFGLELGVGIIQTYVFVLLTCIYLNDAINLH